jgi:hypothetical protein
MVTTSDLDSIPRLTAADLAGFLPRSENGDFEFKCSRVPDDSLKTKLQAAASAFWNSGGGYFVVGVDGSGVPDGGVSKEVGRKPRREWIEQSLAAVDPPFSAGYRIGELDSGDPGSSISPGCAVYLVGFSASELAPHMAPDKRYYIRAGAHTDPASHFLVEAIRARRGVRQPQLRAQFRRDPILDFVTQLGFINVATTPAIDVEIEFENRPPTLSVEVVRTHLIDRDNPFYLQYLNRFGRRPDPEQDKLYAPNNVTLRYRNPSLEMYEETIVVDPRNCVEASILDGTVMDRIALSLQNIATVLARIDLRSVAG